MQVRLCVITTLSVAFCFRTSTFLVCDPFEVILCLCILVRCLVVFGLLSTLQLIQNRWFNFYSLVRLAYFHSIFFSVRRSRRQFNRQWLKSWNHGAFVCSSVWPWLQDNSIMFACVWQARASRRTPSEVTVKRIKIYNSFVFISVWHHHRLAIAHRKWKKHTQNIHSFSVFMSCIYFLIFFFVWLFFWQQRQRHTHRKYSSSSWQI